MAIFISTVFIILTIILLSGKGTFLIAGFNTLSKEEKQKYNKKAFSKQVGWFLLLIDIPIVILTILDQIGKMKDSYALLTGLYIVLVVAIFMILSSIKRHK